jgi:hypothetical protein
MVCGQAAAEFLAGTFAPIVGPEADHRVALIERATPVVSGPLRERLDGGMAIVIHAMYPLATIDRPDSR